MTDDDAADSHDSLLRAMDELKFTIDQAITCETNDQLCAEELLSHCQDLAEDIDAIQFSNTTNRKVKLDAEAIIKDGRRLRRNLNKKALVLMDQRRQSQQTDQTSSVSNITPSPKIKKSNLQKIKIPKFDGDHRKFRPFFDTYNEEVENNIELTPAAKWIHLRDSLEGKAAELVANLPQIPETRSVALDLLQTHYGSRSKTVSDLYRQLQALPPANLHDEQLRFTQAKIEGLLLTLENLGHTVNNNEFVRTIVLDKFPHEFKCSFITHDNMPLQEIRQVIHQRIKARESIASQSTNPFKSFSKTNNTKPSQKPQRNFAERPITCLFCSGHHWSDECTQYKTAEARIKQIPDRCLRCLRSKHEGACRTEKRCVYCDLTSHNRAICPTKFPTTVVLSLIDKQQQNSTAETGVYLTLCIAVRTPSSPIMHTVRAIIDTGGAHNLVTQRLADLLRLKPDPNITAEFLTLNGIELPPARRALTPLQIQTQTDDLLSLSTYITASIAPDLPAADIQQFRTTYPQFNHLYIPPSGTGEPIDLLLSKNSLSRIFTLASSVEVNNEIQLLSTRFGWLILGQNNIPVTKKQNHFSLHVPTEDNIKIMWDLDILGLGYVTNKDSAIEELAIAKFNNSIQFIEGRYYVGWPWKEYPPQLNENFGLALGRLKSLWRKLIKSPDLLQQYDEIILDQEKSNIIEKIPPDSETHNNVKHYIPHHPVIKPDNDSTKIRLVYDASAKLTSKANSLNDTLLKGSNWVTEILTILLRFRKYPVAIVADIAKAFLQIGILPNDRDAVRFLWVKDITQYPQGTNLQIYRFTRAAFGIVSSPFLLYATIIHHLQNYTEPTTNILRKDLYADNLVTSLHTDINPTDFYNKVQEIFQAMSMDMTKWATNCKQLREYIPESKQQTNNIQSVLGLNWNVTTDTLSIKPTDFSPDEHQPISKRRALKQTAKVFDPLGWAVPITLLAKLFIRKLWLSDINWDQDIPTLQSDWDHILLQLKLTSSITLPRAFNTKSEYEIELHTFVDASAAAYAAVTYIVTKTTTVSTSHLLAARNRLSPTTNLTIPRLELLAVLIGCRLTNKIIDALCLNQKPQIFVWTDSLCVLSWISSNKVLPAVVNKQLQEIRKHSDYQFRYVPSDNNYADVASRGATHADLVRIHWWTGPTWLKTTSSWPQTKIIEKLETQPATLESTLFISNKLDEPQTSEANASITGICTITITEFSTLSKLLTRTAFCIRATNLLARSNIIPTQAKYDYSVALKLWIRWSQRLAYPSMQSQSNTTTNYFRNLRTFYDADGIIRCYTRLQHANIEENTIYPILLARKCHLTKLIILQLHTNAKHAGVSQTLSLLRLRYTLPQGRREIQTILNNECYQCRKTNVKPYSAPPPPPLPEFRVTKVDHPFQSTGIDLFGPFTVRNSEPHLNKGQFKKWIIIFTCTVIRAIHLETINNMSTAAILEGIRRFSARRGTPNLFICDSAPQFHILHQKLMNIWSQVYESADGIDYFAKNQISWKFIPPHSPWMGGHYERLIAIIKKSIFTTYGNLTMTDRQFDTFIIEIEAIVNSRPLTYVDKTIDSPIITPNSFLQIKYPAVHIPTSHTNDRLLQLWHASQRHLTTFWNKWSTEYLLALRERDDKLCRKRNSVLIIPQINDIVLVTEPENQRSAWKLARIERLIYSDDKQIRSAQLLLGNGSRIVRPIIKIAPLHIHADLPPADGEISADKTNIILPISSSPTPENDGSSSPIPDDADDDAEIIEIDLDWDNDTSATQIQPTTTKVPVPTKKP